MRICIYAASSAHSDPAYRDDARALGETLARAGHVLVYGGGAVGSMGALADGALAAGGEVIGVIPRFMVELEWGWPGKADAPVQGRTDHDMESNPSRECSDAGLAARGNSRITLDIVEDMRERKHRLLTGSDAVVALPGGCGTLEELLEAITLKQLGIYHQPIVLLNTRGYWTPWAAFIRRQVIEEGFMNPVHASMWSLAETVADVLPAIAAAPAWSEAARAHAVARPR
ncbi:MAG: LOG family protein [Proteobacteria bacterium]|nr:LOG family protein [Pseudomonadota bacterium]